MISKDYALRLVKQRREKLGLTPIRKKRNSVFLSPEDAELLIASYQPWRSATDTNNATVSEGDFGYFYVIQLHPDDLPNRLNIRNLIGNSDGLILVKPPPTFPFSEHPAS